MNMRKEYNKFVERAKFDIPKDSHVFVDDMFFAEFGDKAVDDESTILQKKMISADMFYLPFNVCSVFYNHSESDGYERSVITFKDSVDHSPNAIREFTIVTVAEDYHSRIHGGFRIDTNINLEGFEEGFCKSEMSIENIDRRLITVIYQYDFIDNLGKLKRISDMRERLETDENFKNAMIASHEGISMNIAVAFSFFAKFLVDTKNFVVEETSAKRKKDGTIKSKPSEPLYHVMNVSDIRKIIKYSGSAESETTRAGHERRRHTRTFTSDFYKEKKGQTIVIEACWVGPTEHLDRANNKLYKVRLDVG